MIEFILPQLPPPVNLETIPILKELAKATRSLAELKGYADTIPNKHMLINAVLLNESKDSSAIENIVTTHDEIFQAMAVSPGYSAESKEVINYRRALWYGYQQIKTKGFLTTNLMIEIQAIVEGNNAGLRKLPGTVLRNAATGETIYTPPAGEAEILDLMSNLEVYINEMDQEPDPLIRLAIIHYQFETIHPFYDGNGRTGRILNILYLVLSGLLDSPILYLSSYIIRSKGDYYELLQAVRIHGQWEEWIIYILRGITETAVETLQLVKKINSEIEKMTLEIKDRLPKLYSKELIDQLFFEFYTKTSHLQKALTVSRKTASGYLTLLEQEGFLVSDKIGRERIYQNKRLFDLVKEAGASYQTV